MRRAPITTLTLNVLLVLSLGLSLLGIVPSQAAALPLSSFATTENAASTSASLTALDFPMAGSAASSEASAESSAVAAQAQAGSCSRTLTADVVALDQPFYYNRLGAINANGMIYALRRDVVDKATGLTEAEGGVLTAGNVSLRDDKRPRPIVLRMNEGDCLQINFANLLSPQPFIFQLPADFVDLGQQQIDDQPFTRAASVHVDGLYLVGDIGSDGSNVGQNGNAGNGLVEPGQSTTYTYYAAHEATHLLYSMGSTLGSQGTGGTRSFGLFGAVNVQKGGAEWYRSQLTRQEMDWATTGYTAGADGASGTDDDQPILNYDAVYPAGAGNGKDGLPIIAMLQGNEIVHSDINAIITGPNKGRFNGAYRDNRAAGDRNAPYREFTVIFHDEAFGVQAFPSFYSDPVLQHTLHGVADGFPINYGSGGIGSEIIANRLGVGPMWDCAECKYEEFFLTSFTVGDPAMIVDIPANFDQDGDGLPDPGAKATKALYPDDPSNVHHSYLNDRVKFRNLHAGPKEHHIFHLHAHQWLFNPDDPQSNYLDGQAVGPGSGYTYEIAYGGSGNRNKTAGDSIFHCHFYPHFAQGMWELWRVHDTFEQGTVMELDPADGLPKPAAGSRALPDGEIVAGTPIPGVVPIPTIAMPPMPDAAATIVGSDLNQDGILDSSQFDANGDSVADISQITDTDNDGVGDPLAGLDSNPGYPWFTPGVVGHRPATPALDLLDDGGLPRHVVASGPDEDNPDHAGAPLEQYQTRLDFNKVLHEASAIQIPEGGTAAEKAAMTFHAQRYHPSFKPDGAPADFETNGLPAAAGAPFADPCRTDGGGPISQNRTIKGANIEMAITLNKVGWHFQQQRFEALWEDVLPTLTGARAPQPMIMRLNSTDCAEFWHTNLVPNVYQLDDYQVRTPTDIIGQHIHLVKFDVMSADGSANGWNYEDGTLSPDEVRERIEAFNNGGGLRQLDGTVTASLSPEAHPFFGPTGPDGQNWLGARTTIQRWYADPLLERSWDGGVGTVFTHDHYGPSTHQQVGLYSTLLVEPEGSVWRHNETGAPLATRHDGGPSGWQAIIEPGPGGVSFEPHREFYFEFADFQHAYEAGGGALGSTNNGAGVQIPSYADFDDAINPSFRLPPPNPEDIFYHPNACPGGVGRPCPEAISADDPGTYALNFRNEPIGLRVFNGRLGAAAGQTPGTGGDLAFAYQSRTDRGIAALNSQPATTYPPLTADVQPGDPWTPMLRVYMGDKVRIRVQVGAHEEEHNFTIPGLKWKQEPNSANSGWKNSEFFGIDEYFNLDVPIVPDTASGTPAKVDYIYTVGAELEGMWNGVWGILRSYGSQRNDLVELPGKKVGRNGYDIINEADFNGICPADATLRDFKVTAVRAMDVLGTQGIIYNSRTTSVAAAPGGTGGQGPLIDPTALMYVLDEDLTYDAVTGQPNGLQPGTPVEPLILRANAGDCVQVQLTNALPADLSGTEMPGYNALPPIVHKDENVNGGGITSFNANDLTPSSYVGLTPQLLAFDPRTDGGFSTGLTTGKLVAPGTTGSYSWYAGDVTASNNGVRGNRTQFALSASPVEFGAVGLMPADRIKGNENGLVGAMVVEPRESCWVTDPGTRAQASVWQGAGLSGPCDGTQTGKASFRDFVTVMQNDVNLRYGGGACAADPSSIACAVPSIAADGPTGIPEDPQDSGQKAINYGADPLWFRLGIAPNTKFETIHRNAGLADKIRDVFANSLVGGDPQTEVYRASPDGPREGRFRVVMPGGHARGVTYTLHGHEWQRQPYQNNSSEIGNRSNPGSDYYGSQEGINPTGHWDFLVRLGGYFNVIGDYLWRDQASFGSYQGLWGLLRYNNTAPVAADATMDVAKYGQGTIDLLGEVFDLDGDATTVAISSGPAFGTLADPENDGTFTYTSTAWPACDDVFTCTDSFAYTITDAQGLTSGEGTVTVNVLNTAPVANNDTIIVKAPAVDGSVDLLLNDFDAEGDLDPARSPVVSFAGEPVDRNGNQVGTSADAALGADRRTLTYTPPDGFVGVVLLTYTVTDESRATSNSAVIRAAVNVDDIIITQARYQSQNGRWSISGTCTDPFLPDGTTPTTVTIYFGASIEGEPAVIGTAQCNAGDPVGTWSFSGQVADPAIPAPDPNLENFVSAESDLQGFYEAFPVSFGGQNNAPVAVDDAYSVAEGGQLDAVANDATTPGVLDNDQDADFDPLTAILVDGPLHGNLTLEADGSFVYIHDGSETPSSDSFTYLVSDGKENSALTATVTLTIDPVNDAPLVTITAPADGATVNTADIITFSGTAIDPDGDPADVSAGLEWTATIEGGAPVPLGNGPSFSQTLGEGTYDITAEVADGADSTLIGSASISLTIVATGANQPPVAVDDAYSIAQNGTLAASVADPNTPGVLDNDTDANADPLTVSTVNGDALSVGVEITLASGANLTLNNDGSFTYTPLFNFTGVDAFTYVANDGTADSNVATVTISIADTVTVSQAVYRVRRDRWRIQGTVSDVDNRVDLFLCRASDQPDPANNPCEVREFLGAANVNTIDGSWNFQSSSPATTGNPPSEQLGDQVIAVSSSGGESAPFPVNVRN